MGSETRAFLAWVVYELSDATLTELGRWLGRDVTTLSSAVRRLQEKEKKDPGIMMKKKQLQRNLGKFATLQA